MSDELFDRLQYAIALLEKTDAKLSEIYSRLDALEGRKKDVLTKEEAAELLNVSPRTIEAYKRSWVQGAHYFPQAKGDAFNRELLEDWRMNRRDPAAHQRAVELWLKKRKRSA